jgi:hypothetical protein
METLEDEFGFAVVSSTFIGSVLGEYGPEDEAEARKECLTCGDPAEQMFCCYECGADGGKS